MPRLGSGRLSILTLLALCFGLSTYSLGQETKKKTPEEAPTPKAKEEEPKAKKPEDPQTKEEPKKEEPKAEEKKPDTLPAPVMATKADVDTAKGEAITAAHKYADISWMMVASALVMLMMPGLALFYGGMARRKNILGTMMHTYVALGIVGVQWVAIGYSIAFGETNYKYAISSPEVDKKDDKGEVVKDKDGNTVKENVPNELGLFGYSKELVGLPAATAVGVKEDDVYKEKQIDKEKATDDQKKEVEEETKKRNRFMTFPNTNIPLYLHAMFQGMFAIITIALVSGAFAERVKFITYCLFALIWTTIVYDPLAHMVWSIQWGWLDSQKVNAIFPATGLLGGNGAIDFAGGTVVHIAAGFGGLAATLVLRKRIGFRKQTFHPNSIVLTLTGAGLLWFGWFGFNGGSALYSNGQAVSAFTVTQIAAAAAALAWTIVEWLHRGKPTALGLASGLVAGLVAITPASGYVDPKGAIFIGLAAGVVCYWAVAAKGLLGYDDSLDAFGIHGVGGFLGAILTACFCSLPLWIYGAEMNANQFPGKFDEDPVTKLVTYNMMEQLKWQFKASAISAIYSFIVTGLLVFILDKTIGFTVKPKDEELGLDLSQHGETGMDVGPDVDTLVSTSDRAEPKSASAPPPMPNGQNKRFSVIVEGANAAELRKVWSSMCKTGDTPPKAEFLAVYRYLTTVSGSKFRFGGGDPIEVKRNVQLLFQNALAGSAIVTHVEH